MVRECSVPLADVGELAKLCMALIVLDEPVAIVLMSSSVWPVARRCSGGPMLVREASSGEDAARNGGGG